VGDGEELAAESILEAPVHRHVGVSHLRVLHQAQRHVQVKLGVQLARVSVLKTQRVLRQALVWAEKAGLVPRALLPVEMPAA
jgi:hypothetical protein